MEFVIRRNAPFFDVKVKDENTEIQVGLLDRGECRELAAKLRAAADELDPDGRQS